jgi:hypothetical protein
MRLRALQRCPSRVLRTLLLSSAVQLAAPAWADDGRSTEFWPEINAYVGLGERSRLLLSAAATRAMEGNWTPGKSSTQNAQFTLNYDYTLAPILRRDVPRAEWSKNRLLWARLGLEYGTSGSGGNDSFRSYSGILELNSRYPTPGPVWLTGRLRLDLRDVNGSGSQRYRLRAGAEWDTALLEHPVAPYGSIEFVYDTRYDKWSRMTLKAGLETPFADAWRIEPYLALQFNRPDDELKRVLGVGLTFKVYFD